MFNKEEEKTVISMDMGGAIEPVELPKEEEIVNETTETKSTVVPELMHIGPELKEDLPPVVDNPTEVVKEEIVEKTLPKPTPTIGEVPPIMSLNNTKDNEEKKEEVKEEVKEEIVEKKPLPKPTPTIGEVPPIMSLNNTKENEEEKKEETKEEVKEEVDNKPLPKPTPIIKEVPPVTTVDDNKEEKTSEEIKKEELTQPVQTNESNTAKEDDLEKTMVVPTIDDQRIYDKQKEEREKQKEKELNGENKEDNVEKGPNVIAEPLATEDTKKEKKKDPHFFECPPDCIPIKPIGYVMLNLLYMIPIVGIIAILAHSASYKNLNRRNYARSYLISIIIIIAIVAALIYFLKIDVIKVIEDATGYKIDIQHFKFTKFK